MPCACTHPRRSSDGRSACSQLSRTGGGRYLINSPVVRAQDLAFKEAGVKGVVRDVLLPWYNAYRFFVQSARRYGTALAALAIVDGGVEERKDTTDGTGALRRYVEMMK